MTIGIRGFAAIIAVAALMVFGVACGNGAEPTSLSDEVPTPTPPIVSHGGPVRDYVSLVDNLRAAGVNVDPAGTESADFLAPEKQLLTVNGEDIQAFEFGNAKEADAAAGGVSATGSSIVTTMADGTQKATMITWVAPPHFYKADKLIVLYVGSDSDVNNALQVAMGPQFAGGEAPTPAPPTVGGTTPPDSSAQSTEEIGQAIEAAEGSEVTVSGFLVVDSDGNTRLCSLLAESLPPQCGGDIIDLLGFDASFVPISKTPQGPSDIQTTRWTDSYITVIGIKGIAGLTEVRLSTEAQTTQEEPDEHAPGVQPVPPVSSSMMVPRPESIEVLVRMSQIIILGTISSVLDEKLIGAYGEDGNPYIPVEESGTPYTDYEVRVEGVLKNDGDVEDGGTLVLRMFGHLSQQSDVVTLAAIELPQAGRQPLPVGAGPEPRRHLWVG